MSKTVTILLGTSKGAFLLKSDEARRDWTLKGPFCDTWPINHVTADAATGAIYAGGGHDWVGIDVWRSEDLGETWTKSGDGLAFPEGMDKANSVWSLDAHDGIIYAGTRPAGLFRSEDHGQTWTHVEGLTNHPTRKDWMPGGAGMTLHHIVRDHDDGQKIWIGASSVGVFATEDGGATWEPRNKGIRNDYAETEAGKYPEFGQCCHSITRANGGPVMYQQNHCGMYRSDDDGKSWTSIETGLPSSFGFASAVHPADPETAWFVPMNSDIGGRYVPDAKAAVWRTKDGGKTWKDLRKGLPQQNCYFTVLRQAMATDRASDPGLYFGTNSGSLYASLDEGETWSELARHLPTIFSVETFTAST